MEKGVTLPALPEIIRESFGCREQDIRNYSPLALAYIGDCVYELIIRTVIVEKGNRQPQKLHKEAAGFSKAGTQSGLYKALLEEVSEEERDILKRGRNANSHSKAKNATLSEYKNATALEALFGYLYLTGRMERVLELLKLGLEKCGFDIVREKKVRFHIILPEKMKYKYKEEKMEHENVQSRNLCPCCLSRTCYMRKAAQKYGVIWHIMNLQ